MLYFHLNILKPLKISHKRAYTETQDVFSQSCCGYRQTCDNISQWIIHILKVSSLQGGPNFLKWLAVLES